jgi:hypothetical protein
MSKDIGNTLVLRFEGVSVAEAGMKVAALRDQLLEECPDVQAEIRKTDPRSQDFGTTLVLLLGAPAVVTIAAGLAKYLSRDRQGTLIIERDGTVLFRGNSSDAPAIAKALGTKTK